MSTELKLLVGFLCVGFVSLGYLAVIMLTPTENTAEPTTVVFPDTLQFELARDELVAIGEVSAADAILSTPTGDTVVVANLLGPNGLEETANPGLYEYRSGDVFRSRYTIVYHDFDGSIIISLQTEPLASVRREAEQQLLQLSGLSQSTLCDATILVTTPASVSQAFSGQNLGLSFCPGSLELQ